MRGRGGMSVAEGVWNERMRGGEAEDEEGERESTAKADLAHQDRTV